MDEATAGALAAELEALGLEGVTGYRVLPGERRVLVGLASGPLAAQVASGPDGDDQLEAHFGSLAGKILPVLQRRVPGRQWSSAWVQDDRGSVGGRAGGTLLAFEWR